VPKRPASHALLDAPHQRSVIVTGGTSGIGLATARALLARGSQVAVIGRDAARLDAAIEALDSPRALGLALDVRMPEDMERMAEEVLTRFGSIDVLVTCAGVGKAAGARLPRPVARLRVDAWSDVLDTNLRGTFLADRAVLPEMLRHGHGDIVHVASWPAAERGQPFAAAYSASKAAVAAYSASLAAEVAGRGVRVQLLSPGLVATPLVAGTALAASQGDPLAPERVADAIAALAALPSDVALAGRARSGVVVRRAVAA
jgi:NAD(P)-dependent dehydrogenase (short-subunit alcohol dehydrogenase family)